MLKAKKQSFNVLKVLKIAWIYSEMGLLHPSSYEFWEEYTIRAELMDFWGSDTTLAFLKNIVR